MKYYDRTWRRATALLQELNENFANNGRFTLETLDRPWGFFMNAVGLVLFSIQVQLAETTPGKDDDTNPKNE